MGKDGGCVIPVTRIEVELTEACNLHCRFCYNSCNPVTCSRPYEVLDAIAEAGALELILTGGEPSLHPEFFAILDYARDRFPRVMVQSNGTNFSDAAIFKELARRKPFCLNFSLHGPQNVHQELTKVPGSFHKTIRALNLAAGAGIRTASNLVLTSLNTASDSLLETVRILASSGAREMTLTRFIPCGTGKDALSLTLPAVEFVQTLRILQEETARHGISLLLSNSTPACRLPEDLQYFCNRCSFGFDKFYVDVHGNLLTCGMSRVMLGNILEAPLRKVLESSLVHRQYLDGRHVPDKCRECTDYEMCGGGCRAAGIASCGEIAGEDGLQFFNSN